MAISAVNNTQHSSMSSLLDQTSSNGFDESTLRVGEADESSTSMFEQALHVGIDSINESSNNMQTIVKSGPLTPDKMLALEENTKSFVTNVSLAMAGVKVFNNFVKEMTHIQ